MATLAKVADRAGVSIKTVSRVLKDYEHISSRTRDKVRAAIEELGYAPDSLASQLNTSLSIGMLYSDPSSGYQSKIIHEVLTACSAARRYLAIELFDEESQHWPEQVADFLERTKVGNMILLPPMCDSSDLHQLLREKGIRFVLVSPSRPVPGASLLAMDDRLASTEITRHLIELGHKRIGHISGDPGHVASLLRLQGWREATLKAGLNPSLQATGNFSFKQAFDCARHMLNAPDRPTAIFAANDDMAAAVLMVAHSIGLDVPGDLSVAGFDDTNIAKTIWPALTTVAQPFADIAREAVSLVSKDPQKNSQWSETRVLSHEVLIRDSTGPAPAESAS